LIRVFTTVLAAATKWKSYRRQEGQKRPETLNNAIFCLRKEQQQVAEVMLQVEAQKELVVKDLAALLPQITSVQGHAMKHNLLLVSGLARSKFRIGYNVDGVPPLPSSHPLSELYLREAHEVDHGGVNAQLKYCIA